MGDCKFSNDLSICHSFCFANLFKGHTETVALTSVNVKFMKPSLTLLLVTVDAPFKKMIQSKGIEKQSFYDKDF